MLPCHCLMALLAVAVQGESHATPEVVTWGWNEQGRMEPPLELSNVVAIAAGGGHSLALSADGRVTAWGANYSGQTDVPADLSGVVAIAAGMSLSLAVTAEGHVVAWGTYNDGLTNVAMSAPSELGGVMNVAAGFDHGLALKADGCVVAWGANYYGQTNAPKGLNNVVAIAAGGFHSLALTADGRVEAWGNNSSGQIIVPQGLSNVVAIAAGFYTSLALMADGHLVAWGDNWMGQTDVPGGLTNVVAIASGGSHNLALSANGLVTAWGYGELGQTSVPFGLSDVVAIAAGYDHSLALRGLPPDLSIPVWIGPRSMLAVANQPFHHRILVRNGARSYGAQSLPAGLVLDAGTGLIKGMPSEAGTYSITFSATNSSGLSSWTVTLFVNEPAAPAIGSAGLVQTGLGCGFVYPVKVYNVPEWHDAKGLPLGLAVDVQTGVISGTPLELGDFTVILSAGNRYGLATGEITIRVSSVVAWGGNYYGQTTVPSGLNDVVEIMGGDRHSLALTSDGHFVAWGLNSQGQTNSIVELRDVAAITANLALMTDGQVVARDGNLYGHAEAFSALSNVVALAESGGHYLALTAEGRVEEWKSIGRRWEEVPGLRNVISVATGGSLGSAHSLALCADGRVVAWGDNYYGQTSVPRGLSNVVAIAAGSAHSLALTEEGRVVAWGGYSVFPTQGPSPADVPPGLSNVVAIAAGANHSLALTEEGQVVAWGRDSGFVTEWPGPTDVPIGMSNVVAIVAGGGHSLALTGLPPGMAAPSGIGPRFLIATADHPFHHRIQARNGAAAYGAKGLPPGMSLDSHTGAISGLPANAGIYSVILSATNSVGSSSWTVTLFVNEPAAPYIPGGMVQAVLGCEFNHSVAAFNAPERHDISGLPRGLIMDTQTGVISGVPTELGDFKFSLTASNRYGMDKRTITLRVSPLVSWDNIGNQTKMPIGLSHVVAVSAGYSHSLALTSDGHVVSWDNFDYGQTDVPDDSGFSPVISSWLDFSGYYGLASVPDGLSGVVAIAAGYDHSLALTDEGRVVAWSRYPSMTGLAGAADVPGGLSNVVAIAAGANHSLALTVEGGLVAWGQNFASVIKLTSPADVPGGLSNVVAIAAGAAHNLALTAEGCVVAWGDNSDSQASVPLGLSNVVAIAAGDASSLVLLADGRVAAWGNSWYGQTNVPGELSNVVAIAAGGSRCMALTSAGRVVTWGGLQSRDTDLAGTLTDVVAISARGDHSMALVKQSTVPAPALNLSREISGLELQAHGMPGISCQLLRASHLRGPWFPCEPVTFGNQAKRLRTPVGTESAQFFRLLRK